MSDVAMDGIPRDQPDGDFRVQILTRAATLMDGADRAALDAFLADLRRIADKPAAEGRLAREIVDALEAVTAPPSWGESMGASLAWIGGRLDAAGQPGADPALAMEAQQVAKTLAGVFADSDPVGRAASLGFDWDGLGSLAVIAALPLASRDAATIEFAEASGWHALFTAALQQRPDGSAVGQDAAVASLAPEQPAGQLLAAMDSQPDVVAYATRIRDRAAGMELPALAVLLGEEPIPAALCRPLAGLHDGLALPYGREVAISVTAGIWLARVLAPALPVELGAALTHLLATGPTNAALDAADAALVDLTLEAVQAGRAAERAARDGEDPDDPWVQRGMAVMSVDAVTAAFREPTPDDRLGTLPAIRVTALGQSILAVRATRRGDEGIAWTDIVQLMDSDPDGFDALVLDERCAVLDLVLDSLSEAAL